MTFYKFLLLLMKNLKVTKNLHQYTTLRILNKWEYMCKSSRTHIGKTQKVTIIYFGCHYSILAMTMLFVNFCDSRDRGEKPNNTASSPFKREMIWNI